MEAPRITLDLANRAEQLLIELDEETISTATAKAVAKLLAAVYIEELEQENKLQILSIFNKVEKKIVELITLHGTAEIRNLLRYLLSQLVGKAPEADSPALEVDLDLGAKLFETLHDINTGLRRMRFYAEKRASELPPPPTSFPVVQPAPSLDEVHSPSDLLGPKWKEQPAIPSDFAENYKKLQEVFEILSSDTALCQLSETKASAFVEKGLLKKLESGDEKSIKECFGEVIEFLSDWVLISMVAVRPDEKNIIECRSLVWEGLTELIEQFDLLTIAEATAAELRLEALSSDVPPRESVDGEQWRVVSSKACGAVYQMLNRCGLKLREKKR